VNEALRHLRREKRPSGAARGSKLGEDVLLTACDHKDGNYQPNVPENALLGRQVWQASGPPATGSPAPMAKRGQLNPAHSRWLMGYPPAWDVCAATAMPSSRKSRKSSSKPISR
jgi:hypothetical protein